VKFYWYQFKCYIFLASINLHTQILLICQINALFVKTNKIIGLGIMQCCMQVVLLYSFLFTQLSGFEQTQYALNRTVPSRYILTQFRYHFLLSSSKNIRKRILNLSSFLTKITSDRKLCSS
jgi:hypothetical protein